MTRGTKGFHNVYKSHLDIVIGIISEWNGFGVYAEKLRRLRNELIERGYQMHDINPNHFNTLVHDDLWSTNLMIKPGKNNDDEPFQNVMLIDFQFSFWSSPTIDLHYFLNTSVCESLRPHRFDEFTEFYHQHLITFLKQLNYKKHIPTWTEFQEQYRSRMFHGNKTPSPQCSNRFPSELFFVCFHSL